FFYYVSLPHSHLPSFPTRRSSDLSLSFRRFISDSQCTHRVRRCRLTDSSFFVYPCLCRTLIVPVIGSVGSNTIAASATASSLLSLLLSSRNFDIWHLKPTDSFISRRTSALRP